MDVINFNLDVTSYCKFQKLMQLLRRYFGPARKQSVKGKALLRLPNLLTTNHRQRRQGNFEP